MSTSPVPNNLDLNAAIHPHNSPSLEKPKELEDEDVDLSASQTVAVLDTRTNVGERNVPP
jgi:hypothetical protein